MTVKILDHLSHSQINEFTTCPRRYHLHRRLGLEAEFCPSGLLFGSAIHEALSLFHQLRLEGKEATIDRMMDGFTECIKSERLPVRYGPGESPGLMKALAKRMLLNYLECPRTGGRVLAVEQAFEVSLAVSLPPIQGVIDLVETDTRGHLVVTDFKTASSRREPAPGQLILYCQAMKALDYPGSANLTARYVVLLKKREPEVVSYEIKVAGEDVERLRSLYSSVWQDIQLGCSFPKTGWWCEGCQWQKCCDQA